MLKRSLITLALVAFIGLPALAHDPWTTGTIQITTTASQDVFVARPWNGTIEVFIKVVRWADIYFCNNDDQTLVLTQMNDVGNALYNASAPATTFADCICMKVCVNFAGLVIGVNFTEQSNSPNPKVAVEYYLQATVEGSTYTGSAGASVATLDVPLSQIHLSNNLAEMQLCLIATGVDPQALIYTPQGQQQKIGEITMTLKPSGKPSGNP